MGNAMRFVTDLSKGILGKADSPELWAEIISHIPDDVLLKPGVKILNVSCGHGTEADLLVKRMRALGISAQDVNDSIYLLDKYHVFTNPMKRKGYKNVITSDFLEWETDMKFDVIVGNPPYQDGTQSGGQNKIYNQFSKKALELLKHSGTISFVTPTSVLKESKRFSLVNMDGLKIVDFRANNHFDVGIGICWWMIDKTYQGPVTVYNNQGVSTQSNTNVIYDHSVVNKDFAIIYEALKKHTDIPSKRMFKQNNFGPALSKSKSRDHIYSLYKLEEKQLKLTYWSSRRPYYDSVKKLSIGMTKSLTDDACYVGTEDFDPGYMTINVKDDQEVANIKSFIFSEYFIEHCNKWKSLDGYGYNYGLKYLPPFDKTKSWTNNEVKEFIESYVK